MSTHQIESGLSSVLYHWTRIENAIAILGKNKFFLRKDMSKKQKDRSPYYYMSTSRAKFGGYHIDKKGVIFGLDGLGLGNTLKGGPIDYFHHNPDERPRSRREQDEMEDRIWSQKPSIQNASKYIREIHVCMPSATFNPVDRFEKQIKDLASQHRLPIYFYEDMQDWLALSKKKAITQPDKIAANTFMQTIKSFYTLIKEDI